MYPGSCLGLVLGLILGLFVDPPGEGGRGEGEVLIPIVDSTRLRPVKLGWRIPGSCSTEGRDHQYPGLRELQGGRRSQQEVGERLFVNVTIQCYREEIAGYPITWHEGSSVPK